MAWSYLSFFCHTEVVEVQVSRLRCHTFLVFNEFQFYHDEIENADHGSVYYFTQFERRKKYCCLGCCLFFSVLCCRFFFISFSFLFSFGFCLFDTSSSSNFLYIWHLLVINSNKLLLFFRRSFVIFSIYTLNYLSLFFFSLSFVLFSSFLDLKL